MLNLTWGYKVLTWHCGITYKAGFVNGWNLEGGGGSQYQFIGLCHKTPIGVSVFGDYKTQIGLSSILQWTGTN